MGLEILSLDDNLRAGFYVRSAIMIKFFCSFPFMAGSPAATTAAWHYIICCQDSSAPAAASRQRLYAAASAARSDPAQ